MTSLPFLVGNAGGEEEEKEKQEENHTASNHGFGKNSLQNSSPKLIFQVSLNYSQLRFSYGVILGVFFE